MRQRQSYVNASYFREKAMMYYGLNIVVFTISLAMGIHMIYYGVLLLENV